VKLQTRKNSGFTLIELMIVVAIIAIIASVAIPKLLSARLSANESAAISTLRSISSAQAQMQSSSAIDVDQDGGGEYGYFGELAGTDFLRESDGAGGNQFSPDLLTPPMLSGALGNVDAAGMVQRSGYLFQMFLPNVANLGLAELANGGGGATAVDSDGAEVFWCCYAWPLNFGQTGNRAFFINQDGDILQTNNRLLNYSGTVTVPIADAAYDILAGGSDMSARTANAAAGINPTDLGVWTVLQ